MRLEFLDLIPLDLDDGRRHRCHPLRADCAARHSDAERRRQ